MLFGIMVVHMRHTHSHTRNRRAHHALTPKASSTCPACAGPTVSHRACPTCGVYRGKEAVALKARAAKKAEKKKKKGAVA